MKKTYTLKQIQNMKHLSEYSLTDLFGSVGLYEPILIDVMQIESSKEEIISADDYVYIYPGKDIQMLEGLSNSDSRFMLPCVYCKREQPYQGTKKYPGIIVSCNHISKFIVNGIECEVDAIGKGKVTECALDFKERLLTLKTNILRNWKSVEHTYWCQLDKTHEFHVSFTLEDVEVDTKNDEDKNEGLLVIKKIGQYPSLADMQFFDCIKYKQILHEKYLDYTRALGLFANGIGCGSIVYLRRVFEFLVEEKHKECIEKDGWNEETYQKSSVNDRIHLLEDNQIFVIPAELEEIKSKIYGTLSKGVHELEEDDCRHIFPLLKCTIDYIMDTMINEKKKEKDIKSIITEFHHQ